MRLTTLAFASALLLPVAARADCCVSMWTACVGCASEYVIGPGDGSSSSSPSKTTPVDTLKATRDSYQRQLDDCIKQRDAMNKRIDGLAANLKAYNDALAKLK